MIPPTPEASGEPLSDDRIADLATRAETHALNLGRHTIWPDLAAALRELQQRRAASLPAADVAEARCDICREACMPCCGLRRAVCECPAALDARLSPPQAGETCSLEEGCPCSACAREARILAGGELKLTRYGRLAYEAGRAPEASVDLEELAGDVAWELCHYAGLTKTFGQVPPDMTLHALAKPRILAALQRARETGAKAK